jgi:hypothetical protein
MEGPERRIDGVVRGLNSLAEMQTSSGIDARD